MYKTIKELRQKDQFFTKREVTKECVNIVKKYFYKIEPSLKKILWVEPSAGNGDFYYNFPEAEARLAFDVEKPEHISDNFYIEKNFFDVSFSEENIIFVGNPPFGKRGKMAFDFIIKCIDLNASIIAFILPPNINTKLRLDTIREKGYDLVHREILPDNSFYFDNGEEETDMLAESVFQIYMKKTFIDLYKIETIHRINLRNTDFVQVYTINDNIIKNPSRDTEGKEFTQHGVGKKWIGKCDFYLPLRVFNSKRKINMKVYNDFHDPGISGIGFGIKCKDKDMKNKINLKNCYTIGTNKVRISKKQLILKEIMRIEKERSG